MSLKSSVAVDVDTLSEDVVKKALDKGAWKADILFIDRRSNMLSLSDGSPEKNVSGHSTGAGLRTIDKEGRQGVAYVNSYEEKDLDNLVEWSLYNCDASEPDSKVSLYEGEPPPEEDLGLFDPEVGYISPDLRMDRCLQMTEKALETDKRIISVRSASWVDGSVKIFYGSSAGFKACYKTTYVNSSVTVVLEDNGKKEMGGFGDEARSLKDLDHLEAARKAVERTCLTIGGSALSTGRYDIVLDPGSTVDIIELLGELFLSSNVYKGRSLFGDKLGLKVGSGEITIIDDGKKWGGMGTSPFDGEGYPSSRTVLMDKGVVNSYLYNLKYAAIFRKSSTGNASRGLSTLPDVDITNLYIKPGKREPSSILSSISRGIYVMEFLGLHTVDPVSGDFSLGIKGVLIEKGQFAGPVSGMTIAGNIVNILDSVGEVGKDLHFFGNIGGCTLVMNNVSTAGS